jgi:hypothetical protein
MLYLNESQFALDLRPYVNRNIIVKFQPNGINEIDENKFNSTLYGNLEGFLNRFKLVRFIKKTIDTKNVLENTQNELPKEKEIVKKDKVKHRSKKTKSAIKENNIIKNEINEINTDKDVNNECLLDNIKKDDQV